MISRRTTRTPAKSRTPYMALRKTRRTLCGRPSVSCSLRRRAYRVPYHFVARYVNRCPAAGVYSHPNRPSSIKFPRTLPRLLPYKFDRESVAVVESTERPEEVLRKLVSDGPKMLSALSSITAQPAKDRLPRELDVLVHDMSAYCPTHMLAVYSMTSPNARAHKVTLYPAHHAVLAAYCKNLPRLPPPNPARNHISATQTISLPVVPLCLPCPDTFPLLQSYFYTRRVDALLAALLPIAPAMSESGGQPLSDILGQLARRLSMECTTEKLLGYSITIRGLWRNVCALGVDDEALWRAMDMAWNVVLAAISIISARS